MGSIPIPLQLLLHCAPMPTLHQAWRRKVPSGWRNLSITYKACNRRLLTAKFSRYGHGYGQSKFGRKTPTFCVRNSAISLKSKRNPAPKLVRDWQRTLIMIPQVSVAPHLASRRAVFYMISENKLFLLEMTKTATVQLTESVRTMAVFTIHFF